ncbi:MAG: acyl-CoA thioesterase [Bacteroidales bacterium]|nr:acyl-CoA thioesterase [Bacteroidales bacterium]
MRPYVHKVNYYECDKMGVTHHSNYIRFMEESRIDFLDQLGYGFDRMEAEGIVSPVVAVECNYKKTTTFKDEITIEIKISEVSTLKMKISYTMKVQGKVVCTGVTTHCFFENGRPAIIPERFPELAVGVGNTEN